MKSRPGPSRYLLIILSLFSSAITLHAQTYLGYKTLMPPAQVRINGADRAMMIYIPSVEYAKSSNESDAGLAYNKFNWNFEEQRFIKSKQQAGGVKKKGFYIYNTLVTVAQYRHFCESTGRQMPEAPSCGWNAASPMVNISRQDASDYCTWAGGRLPYQAEWEYAAQAGNSDIGGQHSAIFVWEDNMPVKFTGSPTENVLQEPAYSAKPSFGIFAGYDYHFAKMSPAIIFTANYLRVYEMGGNVPEWCTDWFTINYDNNALTRSRLRVVEEETRVLCSTGYPTNIIAAMSRRLTNGSSIRANNIGFRCVVE